MGAYRGRAARQPRAACWQSRCHGIAPAPRAHAHHAAQGIPAHSGSGVPRARRVRRAARGRNDTAGTAPAFARRARSRRMRFGEVGERRRRPVARRSRAARSSAVTLAIRPARFRGGWSARGAVDHRSLYAARGAGVLSSVAAARCANPVGGGAGGGRGSLYPPVVKVARAFRSETRMRAPCAGVAGIGTPREGPSAAAD
jgi:hypothetical protein